MAIVKPYINFNTDKRKETNSVYGKSIENIRKRIKVRLVANAKNY